MAEKNKVVISVVFRGREAAHMDEGRKVVEQDDQALQDVGKVEWPPEHDGQAHLLHDDAEVNSEQTHPQIAQISQMNKRSFFRFLICEICVVCGSLLSGTPADAGSSIPVECDLLIVGGSESAVAAAIQAARLGVKRIVLVNDGTWLGGQFTSEAIGAVDEWTKYRDGRVPFPRSGLFLEIMTMIEDDMQRKYGLRRPGNCFCAWTTCEPRDTEALFRKLIAPYLAENGGPIEMLENVEPARSSCGKAASPSVRFRRRR